MQIMVSSILPKNERWVNFHYIKLSQCLFFGRIVDTLNCFRDLLTFSLASEFLSHKNDISVHSHSSMVHKYFFKRFHNFFKGQVECIELMLFFSFQMSLKQIGEMFQKSMVSLPVHQRPIEINVKVNPKIFNCPENKKSLM